MLFSLKEYAKKYKFKGKQVSTRTIIRRCEKRMLPIGHRARKLPGKTGSWVIEVRDY